MSSIGSVWYVWYVWDVWCMVGTICWSLHIHTIPTSCAIQVPNYAHHPICTH